MIFVHCFKTTNLNQIKTIAFTHKTTDLNDIGKLYIDELDRKEKLSKLLPLGIKEIYYLATCNRVEFTFVDDFELSNSRKKDIFFTVYPTWTNEEIDWAIEKAQVFEGKQAVEHLFITAASLDSLVVGEREIITQVKNAYTECFNLGLTGDVLRIVTTKTIECAKKIYTNTNIARNPVSIVSLAFRMLKRLNLSLDASVLVVGAGETNTKMCKFLYKHGFRNFTVANRTLANAQTLANLVKGDALALSDLPNYTKGFDLLLTCTGSDTAIFTPQLYSAILNGETTKKVVVDLALPNDVSKEVLQNNLINYIEIESLKKISEKNLQERHKELAKCEVVIDKYLEAFEESFHQRQIELAMRDVPLRMKKIKEKAFNEVFVKDIQNLDPKSREVLYKMFDYLEKKYISVPMKMAKEILIKK